MEKFELLRKKAVEENEVYKIRDLKEIQEENTYMLQHYLTDLRIKQLANNEITREQAVEIATKKIEKEYKKRIETILKKIESIEQAEEIQNISISVEWVRNRTWGYNPTAYVFTAYTGQTTGTAGSCGYDKESAAIAEAFNKNNSILKIIFKMKEKALKDNEDITSHDACGYGAGYGALPYFEGGVGVSCFIRILKSAGFSCIEIHGKSSDSYNFTKQKEAEENEGNNN